MFHGKVYPDTIRLIGGFPEAAASTSYNTAVWLYLLPAVDNRSSKEILSVSSEMVTVRPNFAFGITTYDF